MTLAAADVPDPRAFPDAADAPGDARALYSLAAASLGATTGVASDATDRDLRAALRSLLVGDGAVLAGTFAAAPSVAVARKLWRELDAAWREPSADGDGALAAHVFALPAVIVAGAEGEGAGHPGTLADPARLASILQEHGALAGNRAFALADALVAADALDLPRLPELLAWQRLPDAAAPGAPPPAHALPPAPLAFAVGHESVHLRFVVGTAVARPDADLFRDAAVGAWGLPFARELSRGLAVPRASTLALPRAPQRPIPAVAQGRAAHREVGAQVFASNAIRRIRATVGEPVAVISAHRAADAPGGGELRLSLSSPFAPRDAEGFRCPLYPLDRAGDVATMLGRLMADCRVADVRFVPGVHADRDPATGLTLLFKPDALPDPPPVH